MARIDLEWATARVIDDGTLDHVREFTCKICKATKIERFADKPTIDDLERADSDNQWCDCGDAGGPDAPEPGSYCTSI